MSKLSACQAVPPSIFLFQIGFCFKIPHFREPCGLGPCQFASGGGLTEQRLGTSLPQKTFLQSHRGRGLEIIANHNTANAKFHHTLVSLSPHHQMWLFSGVCWNLCLWGGHVASIKCTPGRETASPHVAHSTLRSLLPAPGD